MEKEHLAKRVVRRWTRRLVVFSAAWLCAIHLLWYPFVLARDVRHYKFWDYVLSATRSIEREKGYSPRDVDGDGSHSVSGIEKYLPQSMDEISPTAAKHFVLTTGEQYAFLRDNYSSGMILAERRPHRTIFPFPFGAWVTYARQYEGAREPSVVRISSDWKARQFCARIAKQEGGGFNLAASFIPDVMTYALVLGVVVLSIRRQYVKSREDSAITEQFSRLGAALVDFRDRTGRFPKSLKELGVDVSTGEYDAVLRRGLLFLHQYGCGVALATARPWRKSFGTRKRALAILDDGTLVSMHGVFQLDSFYDKIRAARDGFDIGHFYTNKKKKLKFQHDDSYADSCCPLGFALKMLVVGCAPLICCWSFYGLIAPFFDKLLSGSELFRIFFNHLNPPISFEDLFSGLSIFMIHLFTFFVPYVLTIYLFYSKKSIYLKTSFVFLSLLLFGFIVFLDIAIGLGILLLWDSGGIGNLIVSFFLCGPYTTGWIALPRDFYRFIASLYGLI